MVSMGLEIEKGEALKIAGFLWLLAIITALSTFIWFWIYTFTGFFPNYNSILYWFLMIARNIIWIVALWFTWIGLSEIEDTLKYGVLIAILGWILYAVWLIQNSLVAFKILTRYIFLIDILGLTGHALLTIGYILLIGNLYSISQFFGDNSMKIGVFLLFFYVMRFLGGLMIYTVIIFGIPTWGLLFGLMVFSYLICVIIATIGIILVSIACMHLAEAV